jgi:hypothetical protein
MNDMKMNKKLFVAASVLLTLCSCGAKSPASLSKYVIEKKETISHQKVEQIIPTINCDAVGEVSVAYETSYEGLPFFFTEDCSMNKDELIAFADTYHLSQSMLDEKHATVGTSLFTYNDNHEKEVSVTITVNGEGYRAGYLTADVDDYYVLDQESNTSFHIYACVTELAVEVLDA